MRRNAMAGPTYPAVTVEDILIFAGSTVMSENTVKFREGTLPYFEIYYMLFRFPRSEGCRNWGVYQRYESLTCEIL